MPLQPKYTCSLFQGIQYVIMRLSMRLSQVSKSAAVYTGQILRRFVGTPNYCVVFVHIRGIGMYLRIFSGYTHRPL